MLRLLSFFFLSFALFLEAAGHHALEPDVERISGVRIPDLQEVELPVLADRRDCFVHLCRKAPCDGLSEDDLDLQLLRAEDAVNIPGIRHMGVDAGDIFLCASPVVFWLFEKFFCNVFQVCLHSAPEGLLQFDGYAFPARSPHIAGRGGP